MQIEWVHKAKESWNQFNFFLVNSGSSAMFETFVQGEAVADHERANLNGVVFSYLNIIYPVWVARNEDLVEAEFADKMLVDHVAILRRNKEIVLPLLKMRGYPNGFCEHVYPGSTSK